jgi:hypothetical protein
LVQSIREIAVTRINADANLKRLENDVLPDTAHKTDFQSQNEQTRIESMNSTIGEHH